MKFEFNRQALVFNAILEATPEQIIRIVKSWAVGKHAFEGIDLEARQTGKYKDRVAIDYYQDIDEGDRQYRNAGEVITHGNLSSTHVSISFWDWESHEAGWAEWNGFASLPNAKVIFEDLGNTLRRKIPIIQDNFSPIALMPETKDLLRLPHIENPTDQRIWEWVQKDPSLTDTDIAQKLNISRQAINTRRKGLEKMGYPVRVSRQK